MYLEKNSKNGLKNNPNKKFRFSIRKYHFGAASAMVGAVIFLGGGVATATENNVEVVKEEISSTNNQVSRNVQIPYKVVQVDTETGKEYKIGQVYYASVETTSEEAEATVSYTIQESDIRSGYELAEGQSITVSKKVVLGKNSDNVIKFNITKKATVTEEKTESYTGFRTINSVDTLTDVQDGKGELINTETTATPSMDDPNGADVSSKTQGSYVPTANANYLTIQYTSVAYFDAIATQYEPFKSNGGAKTGGAYFRTSINPNNINGKLLVELVDSNGTVVETNEVGPNESVQFNYYKDTNAAGYPFVYHYDYDASSENMLGTIRVQLLHNTMSAIAQKLIKPTENPTVYETEAGEKLATYTVVTSPDLTTVPSAKREFAGYTFKETKTTTENLTIVPTEPYLEVVRYGTGGIKYKTIVTPMGADGSVKKTYYAADPNYTGTHSFTDTNTDGFIPIIETSVMKPGEKNTNFMGLPDVLAKYEVYFVNAKTEAIYTDKESDKRPTPVGGIQVTTADEFDFSRITEKEHWFHIKWNEKKDGTLAFTRIQFERPGDPTRIRSEYDIYNLDNNATTTTVNGTQGLSWKGILHSYNLQNDAHTISKTTHIYTPDIQEAVVKYKLEDGTALEESSALTGDSGTAINYSTEDTINKYKKLGYELVSDGFTTDSGQKYDYATGITQEFEVVLTPRIIEVPKDSVPGQPVDPTDPNSPVWPDTIANATRTEEVVRTVEYKYEDGTPVLVDDTGTVLPKGSTNGTPLVKTEKVTFTRSVKVNLVTGELTYGDWVADNGTILNGQELPTVPGYEASRTTLEGVDAPMSESTSDKAVEATSKDINEIVYFKEIPKYGDVEVNYENEEGKKIALQYKDTDDALVGTEYNTTDNNSKPEKIVEDSTGDVYYIKPAGEEIKTGSSPEIGTVKEGKTEVTYVYEKAGNVKVNYQLKDGTTIKASVMDVENGKPRTDYDTKDKKETEIKTADGKVYRLVEASTKGNETGQVEAGKTLEVTYVYEEVKGNVVVNYENEEGKVIDLPATDTNNASIGTKYDTTDNGLKQEKIVEDSTGDVYYIKPAGEEIKAGSSPETGTVSEGTTNVTYVYEKAGNVKVNYQLADGTTIKASVMDVENGKPRTDYDTKDKKELVIRTADGKVYRLVEASTIGNETGTVEAGKTLEVTYIYEEVKSDNPTPPTKPNDKLPNTGASTTTTAVSGMGLLAIATLLMFRRRNNK